MCFKILTFSRNNKKFKINLQECGFLRRITGLMFRTKHTNPLLFELKSPRAIHSFFVFFPFVAVWLDKNNKVVEIKKVKPFTLHVLPKKHFAKLVEIPVNKKNKKILRNLVMNGPGGNRTPVFREPHFY